MTQVETLSPETNLTDPTRVQENKGGSVEPAREDVSLEQKGFQAALQKKAELIKLREEQLEEANRKLRERDDADKQRKLADMTEVERYKSVAEEESKRRGELEMRLIVNEAIAGKNIPSAVIDLIKETPWAIPTAKRELGDDFTWDEAIEAVRRHLPEYIETLVVDRPTMISEEPLKKVDSERSIGETSTFSSGHVYTQREVVEISKDPREYEKHRDAIMRQLSKSGGILPEY